MVWRAPDASVGVTDRARSYVGVIEDDLTVGFTGSIVTLGNIGPGFGDVGPSENYAFISDTGKWFLAWNMLVGRLEMFSALVVFYPSFWKK